MKSKYRVYGWLNGEKYDAGDNASATVEVSATDESQAEDIGDTKLKKSIGTCDVVVAVKIWRL